MFKLSEYSFLAGVITVALAFGCYLLAFMSVAVTRRRSSFAGAGAGGGNISIGAEAGGTGLGTYGTLFTYLALTFLTAALIFRALATGHGPFANMYEFSIAFAWGTLAMFAYFEHRYHQRVLGLIALPIALALLLYATTVPAQFDPLVPALQNNLLLSVHVAVAIVAYGTFAVAFAAAVLYLLQTDAGRRGLPRRELLDEISYKAVMIGFPFLTLTIVLGAVWANVAWGRYWGWDPKETASLVTWLIYGAYLHARVVRGWRGERAAYLLLLGFTAVLFTYFGNLFFGGLHSYSGLNGN
ncbi:MAG TPA: c-type cytochrome biogenesis protein CcsB [Candidatus Limnocylindrales bacterium]|nr:c-type cytochrome biogenesis protein CcsB [Candidatus Limnocylindrales bacterium]